MEVFLPIAQVFVNPIEILLLIAIVGVLSGLFGFWCYHLLDYLYFIILNTEQRCSVFESK